MLCGHCSHWIKYEATWCRWFGFGSGGGGGSGSGSLTAAKPGRLINPATGHRRGCVLLTLRWRSCEICRTKTLWKKQHISLSNTWSHSWIFMTETNCPIRSWRKIINNPAVFFFLSAVISQISSRVYFPSAPPLIIFMQSGSAEDDSKLLWRRGDTRFKSQVCLHFASKPVEV